MSTIQNNVNKMFEEKERQDQLASFIVDQRNNEFEVFLKQQQTQQELQNETIKQQEIAYENSFYYQNYQMLLNMLEQSVITIYYEIIQNYQNNNTIFKNPYYEEIKNQKIVSGIGYPVPDKYLNQIKQIVKNKLIEISVIEDGEFEVDMVPTKYIKQGNIMKKIDSYALEVTLNKKKKNKLK